MIVLNAQETKLSESLQSSFCEEREKWIGLKHATGSRSSVMGYTRTRKRFQELRKLWVRNPRACLQKVG